MTPPEDGPGPASSAPTSRATTGSRDDDRATAPIRAVPVAVVALVLIALAATFMRTGSLNVDAFEAVQAVTRHVPDVLWSCVTICGTGVVAFALLSPAVALHPRFYAAAVVAAPLAGAYSNGMKRVFGLPRPASVLDAAHLHAIGHELRYNTFPSGHAVTAFTLAAIVVFASKRPLRAAAWVLPAAALVALSRIAVGAHWPADLAAGAAGGWVSGAVGVLVVARWRVWNTVVGIRALAIVAVGIGVSLFVVDLGYPEAVALQYAAGALAVAMGLQALRRPRLDVVLPHGP